MSFISLSHDDKAQLLLDRTLCAASDYYTRSDGVHIEEIGVERLVQVKLWDAISEPSDGVATYCTMETGPSDVLLWSGDRTQDAVFSRMTIADTRSRFDLVYHSEIAQKVRPRGIIEVKIGRKSAEFLKDLLRIFEFSTIANQYYPTHLELVAVLFVERNLCQSDLDRHKNWIDSCCSGKFQPIWKCGTKSYLDRRDPSREHVLTACIASVPLQ
jgi:hypothetical protein